MDVKRPLQKKKKDSGVYKKQVKTDRYGNESFGYPEEPTETLNILWYPVTGEAEIAEYGERVNEMLQGCLFDESASVTGNDRIKVDEILYNVVAIKPYPSYRLLTIERVD